MAAVVVAVIAILYIPMGLLPILPQMAEREEHGGRVS